MMRRIKSLPRTLTIATLLLAAAMTLFSGWTSFWAIFSQPTLSEKQGGRLFIFAGVISLLAVFVVARYADRRGAAAILSCAYLPLFVVSTLLATIYSQASGPSGSYWGWYSFLIPWGVLALILLAELLVVYRRARS